MVCGMACGMAFAYLPHDWHRLSHQSNFFNNGSNVHLAAKLNSSSAMPTLDQVHQIQKAHKSDRDVNISIFAW